MTQMNRVKSEQLDHDWVAAIAVGFGLETPREVSPLGGTASPKFAIRVPGGRFVVRVRHPEFAGVACVRFDHTSLLRLAAAGLPVPCPRRRADGTSWFCHDGQTVEVLSWVDGDDFPDGDEKALHNLGVFLARFHDVLADNIPEGKEGLLREDHPDLLSRYVEPLRALARRREEAEQLDRVAAQLEFVRAHLDHGLYESLPASVIHGDIHPGNIRFSGSEVSAVYDFDYLSLQARVRDLVDAIMFFAARRDEPLRPDDIWSLTQPFRPCPAAARILVGAYQVRRPLTEAEWRAIPLLMRSQWLQIRLRGSRKVPEETRLKFVLDGLFRVIDWLDDESGAFMDHLRRTDG